MTTRGKLLLSALAVGVGAFLILQTPILRRVRGWAWDGWVGSIGRVVGVGQLRVEEDVLHQLQSLRAENTRLTGELRRFQRVEKQLGSSSFSGFRQIPALMAARPIDTYSATYVINQGADDGVQVGAPV